MREHSGIQEILNRPFDADISLRPARIDVSAEPRASRSVQPQDEKVPMALLDLAEPAAAFDPLEQEAIQHSAVRVAKSIGKHFAKGPAGLDFTCGCGLSLHKS